MPGMYIKFFTLFQHMVGAAPNWSYLWCEVKSGLMKGWNRPDESNSEPQFSIDLMPKVGCYRLVGLSTNMYSTQRQE